MADSWSSVPQSVRDKLRAYVFERDGYVCRVRRSPRCNGRAEELDHIVPRGQGGAVFDPDNMRASCANCNRGRRDRKIRIAASRRW